MKVLTYSDGSHDHFLTEPEIVKSLLLEPGKIIEVARSDFLGEPGVRITTRPDTTVTEKIVVIPDPIIVKAT